MLRWIKQHNALIVLSNAVGISKFKKISYYFFFTAKYHTTSNINYVYKHIA